jgi:hypothetical protein
VIMVGPLDRRNRLGGELAPTWTVRVSRQRSFGARWVQPTCTTCAGSRCPPSTHDRPTCEERMLSM